MIKSEWITRLKEACEAAGTYRPFFDDLIDSLASLLELRDKCEEQLQHEPLLIERTNQKGFSSMIKNPILSVYDETTRNALNYWRELGLTPAVFKRMKSGPSVFDQTEEGLSPAMARIKKAMEEA